MRVAPVACTHQSGRTAMLRERGTDRRRGYSLRKHIQRVVRTKGLRRVLLPVATTMVVAGALLANCDGGSRITGPGEPAAPKKLLRPGFLVTTSPEVTESVPIEPMPDPCTGELVQGTLEVRSSFDVDDQTPHITLHMKFRFSGNGVTETTDALGNVVRTPTSTTYTGSGEHDEELNANENSEKLESGFTEDFRIFAKNSAVAESDDDFMSHWNVHATVFLVPPRTTAEVNNLFFDCK